LNARQCFFVKFGAEIYDVILNLCVQRWTGPCQIRPLALEHTEPD